MERARRKEIAGGGARGVYATVKSLQLPSVSQICVRKWLPWSVCPSVCVFVCDVGAAHAALFYVVVFFIL